jgi:hypothetical protein
MDRDKAMNQMLRRIRSCLNQDKELYISNVDMAVGDGYMFTISIGSYEAGTHQSFDGDCAEQTSKIRLQ